MADKILFASSYTYVITQGIPPLLDEARDITSVVVKVERAFCAALYMGTVEPGAHSFRN